MKKILLLFYAFFIIAECDILIDETETFDYSIQQKMDCYCPQANRWVKLFVTDEKVKKGIRISDNSELSQNEIGYYKSIQDLFDTIASIDTTLQYVIVNYDEKNTHPAYVYIDYKPVVINDTLVVNIADGQVAFTTKDFIKLR